MLCCVIRSSRFKDRLIMSESLPKRFKSGNPEKKEESSQDLFEESPDMEGEKINTPVVSKMLNF